ncbi:hypothetical protein [Streptomyces sp. NPDC101181]|uniref:hypothetical protein n=1 Tax=Streptomyces sp. NPDC101181 TaxID=3366125 RepID=UPI003806CC10
MATAGSNPAITLAVGMALWHFYEFTKVIRTHRKGKTWSIRSIFTISNRKVEVGMKIIEFIMSAVSVVVGVGHVVVAE